MDHKEELISFMHKAGFEWICDIDYVDHCEIVASHKGDGTKWWRPVETEGSGFERLFKGAIKRALLKNRNYER